jgi:hypothetical protein
VTDLTTLAHRLNALLEERQSIAVTLLNGTTLLPLATVHALKARYSKVAQAIARLEKRLK